MRIGLLSRSGEIYSTRRLREAAESRGHEVLVADPGRCALGVGAEGRSINYRGIELVGFDAVIPRVATSTNSYGSAVVRQFELAGVFCLNGAGPIALARDKLVCAQMLSAAGVDIPRTAFAHSPRYAEDLVRMVGGPPVVIKVLEGTQGVGVLLADSLRAARSTLDAFWGVGVGVLLQEYIHEAEGSDLRFIVLGEDVVTVMLRQSVGDEFRSNLHRGGTGAPAASTEAERALAVRAVKALGLGCAGVDIVRSRRGPLVLEVNGSPGLEGVEEASGVDLADRIIEYVETRCAQRDAADRPPAHRPSDMRPAAQRRAVVGRRSARRPGLTEQPFEKPAHAAADLFDAVAALLHDDRRAPRPGEALADRGKGVHGEAKGSDGIPRKRVGAERDHQRVRGKGGHRRAARRRGPRGRCASSVPRGSGKLRSRPRRRRRRARRRGPRSTGRPSPGPREAKRRAPAAHA